MYIWLALLIPIVAIIILYVFFHKNIAWWESGVIILIVMGFIATMKYCTEQSQISDVEYLQDYIVRVEYYEDWNEEVPCSHPKYCTRYNSCKTTDSKGKCEGGYEEYQCGWEHAYDVDYHPEHWAMISSMNNSYGIDRNDWERLKVQFHATPIFQDMNRDYHDNDGDMYHFSWDRKIESVEYIITQHSYENRVQASHTVLNFPEVDTAYKRLYAIKDYPEVSNLMCNALLGETNQKVDRYVNQCNALYASNKQVKVFYMIYKNAPFEAGLIQEQYWKGGNKNEVNICIGIDNNRNIRWAYVFSWTKQEIVKIDIRDYINEQKVLNDSTYYKIINHSNAVIQNKFVRRYFEEFSYLTVEPTKTAVIWTYIISFILTAGLSVFVVMNEIDE